MLLDLALSDGRLGKRYQQLVVSHLSPEQRLSAGIHPPPSVARQLSAVQGMSRFLNNQRVTLPALADPLIRAARQSVARSCHSYALVAMDWCQIHFNGHFTLKDRVELAHKNDFGYEMLTSLLIGDRDGVPIGPVAMELRAADGLHSTRSTAVLPESSQLDGVLPMMIETRSLELGKPLVYIIDAEADSVGHYRQWQAMGLEFVVRADKERVVLHDGAERQLGELADSLRQNNQLEPSEKINFKGRRARTFVGQTTVVLHRPARTHRVDADGSKRRRNIPGPAIPLRLVVSEVRDDAGAVLARWLLLTNLPTDRVKPQVIARWYYWRWRIESFHKLLKQAGYFLEQWQQESAGAIAKRLLLAAMACVIVWRLAADESNQADRFRRVLVELGGRQINPTKNPRGFTAPALLAGLGVLIPMLNLLEKYRPQELASMAQAAFSFMHPQLC
jgi:Transposase DDE domain